MSQKIESASNQYQQMNVTLNINVLIGPVCAKVTNIRALGPVIVSPSKVNSARSVWLWVFDIGCHVDEM